MDDITLEQARAALAAAVAKAQQIGTKMNIAVVDAGANLKAFVRMDGAWLGSIDIAIRKARTARLFDMNTGQIGQLSQPGGPLFGIEHSNGGLISFPGGIPLLKQGRHGRGRNRRFRQQRGKRPSGGRGRRGGDEMKDDLSCPVRPLYFIPLP